VIRQIGEVFWHAIASVERKQAMLSNEVTEISFTVPDCLDTVRFDPDVYGTITLDSGVSTGDGDFLYYGTVSDRAIDSLKTLVERLSYMTWVEVINRESEPIRFELQLFYPPILVALASHGGYLQQWAIVDGDLHLTVHLPPTANIRRIIDVFQETYPTA